MLKFFPPAIFCLLSSVSHAGWVQLGTFDNPNLANSVVVGCEHRIVNTASRVVYIYPTVFTESQTSPPSYDFHAPSNPAIMQRMLLNNIPHSDPKAMHRKLRQAFDYLHAQYEGEKIREVAFTARILGPTTGDNRNKIYINTSFYRYESTQALDNFTISGSGFEIDPIYYPFFALQQSCS